VVAQSSSSNPSTATLRKGTAFGNVEFKLVDVPELGYSSLDLDKDRHCYPQGELLKIKNLNYSLLFRFEMRIKVYIWYIQLLDLRLSS